MTIDNVGNLCLWCMEEMGSSSCCPHCGHVEGDPSLQSGDKNQGLSAGSILGGHYLIGRMLFDSGFAITYLAYDLELHIKRVIQEYYPYYACSRLDDRTIQVTQQEQYQKGLESFFEDVQLRARFGWHPDTVGFCDYFQSGGTSYLVMDYIDGVPFEDYLKAHGNKLSWDKVLQILNPIFNVLQELHTAGMLNLDIQPKYILISSSGNSKLSLRLFPDYNNTSSGEAIRFFPHYAPVERYGSKQHLGTYTDVYALAATFYRAVSGIVPQSCSDRALIDTLIPLHKLDPGIPETVSNAISHAMSVRPAARTQTVAEFLKELKS